MKELDELAADLRQYLAAKETELRKSPMVNSYLDGSLLTDSQILKVLNWTAKTQKLTPFTNLR